MSKPFALQHKARYRIVTACGRVYDCATFNRDDMQFVIRPPSRRTFPVERVTLVAPRIDVRYSYARSSFVAMAQCVVSYEPTSKEDVRTRRVHALHKRARVVKPDLFVPAPWVNPIRARALPLPTGITR